MNLGKEVRLTRWAWYFSLSENTYQFLTPLFPDQCISTNILEIPTHYHRAFTHNLLVLLAVGNVQSETCFHCDLTMV